MKMKEFLLDIIDCPIIDISDSANQPMVEKNSIISFNGEVYIYLDIKRKYFFQLMRRNSILQVMQKYYLNLGRKKEREKFR